MKPRRLLSSVELLPTISEMQEGDLEDGEDDYPTMEEYVDSIKELSQPTPYPLHSLPRWHRRWMTSSATQPVGRCPTVAQLAPYNKSMAYSPRIPSGLSDVSLMVTHPLDGVTRVCSGRDPLDWLFAQAQFSGLT
ncbi:uncharacterized protein si:ch73-6k14.2 [Coregonus clupeaformis]|uniref:uncharacterized protein si:ch73-6k14.2 n=1 Tax=Coregonus clupeaformis TaxID=59861 RepID=UPI001E1C7713|nr:uncharacterized protein si:ch73-6k14.2 [Coregonus clupeaformis]